MESTIFHAAMPSSPSFFHLLESEGDFSFGAKTTSFLPPATVKNAAATTTTTTAAAYDLPDWMEGREVLGLPGLPGLPEDLLSPFSPSTPQGDNLLKLGDLYSTTIKPEDMLVPLSELQPPHTPGSPPYVITPPASPPFSPVSPPYVPGSPVHPAPVPADPPIPKVIICRKVTASSLKSKPIQVHFQVMPVKQVPQATLGTPLMMHAAPHIPDVPSLNTHEDQVAVMPVKGSHGVPQVYGMALPVPQSPTAAQVPEFCDAEELINEMVQMIGGSSNTGDLQDLESISFDPSLMEASMQGLLSQLETSDTVTTPMHSQPLSSPSLQHLSTSLPTESSVPSYPSQSPSPISIRVSSYPSQSPSPASISVPSYPSESPSPASLCVSLPSPASLPSPVPSVGSLSPAQSSFCGEASTDVECLEQEWNPLEETHSYSRSQRKAKSSHRTSGARKTPYPQDRKERKKEQNKLAALRYRNKKKQEEDELTDIIEVEEERQQKLQSKYSGLKQELGYLKKMMREMFVARGLLSEEALKKAAMEKRSSSK